MDVSPLDRHAIVEQLERMLSSASFRRAGRSSVLLRYLIEQTIDGHADRLKEFTVGAEALGRGTSFDPRTDGARGPFFSPDGQWVGFWADGNVKKTSVNGGAPVVLFPATDLLGASWGQDGHIIAALNPTRKLWRVPAIGGTPEVVLDLTAESSTPAWPQILPGGEWLLYTVNTAAGADRATIEVLSLRTRERTVLVRGGTFGRYLSSGHLTYVNQGTLYAVRFDVNRGAVEGSPAPVVHDVSYSRTFGYAQMDVSQTGTLVYREGAEGGRLVAVWVDRSGNTTPLIEKPGQYAWLRVSPDGRRLAFAATESGVTHISVHDPTSNASRRLSTKAGDHSGFTWWPLGHRLVFHNATGMAWIDVERPELSGALTTSQGVQVPWSIAPDGRLAYYEIDPDTGFDVWTMPIEASDNGLKAGTPQPFLRTPAFEVYPSFSPDGRWIAYASNESGTFEVYVRRFPDDGKQVQVSKGGGSTPHWLPNGRELVYRADNQQIMVASYRFAANAFVAGLSRQWPSSLVADTGVLPNFDLAPNGARIAALVPATRPGGQQTMNHVTVMLNFADEVRRRAAAR